MSKKMRYEFTCCDSSCIAGEMTGASKMPGVGDTVGGSVKGLPRAVPSCIGKDPSSNFSVSGAKCTCLDDWASAAALAGAASV